MLVVRNVSNSVPVIFFFQYAGIVLNLCIFSIFSKKNVANKLFRTFVWLHGLICLIRVGDFVDQVEETFCIVFIVLDLICESLSFMVL